MVLFLKSQEPRGIKNLDISFRCLGGSCLVLSSTKSLAQIVSFILRHSTLFWLKSCGPKEKMNLFLMLLMQPVLVQKVNGFL